jgi:hypothetical protein
VCVCVCSVRGVQRSYEHTEAAQATAAMTSRRRGRSEFEDNNDDGADSNGVSLSARPTRRAALEGDRERRDRFVPVRSAMDMATGSYLVTKENPEAGAGGDAVNSSKGSSSGLDATSTEAFNLSLEASLLGGAAGGSAGEFSCIICSAQGTMSTCNSMQWTCADQTK